MKFNVAVRGVALLVVLSMFLLSTCTPLVLGMQFKLRDRKGEAQSTPRNSEDVLNKLIAFFHEDADMGTGLSEWASDTGFGGNYCRVQGFTCNDRQMITKMTLKNITGDVEWKSLPKTVQEVHIDGAHFSTADVTNLPYWLKVVHLQNVTFDAPQLAFHTKHPGLHTFVCRECGLRSIAWDTIPGLLHLDLSQNPDLETNESLVFPQTLQHLNISNNLMLLNVEKMGPLPPSLQTMDFSNNQVRGRMGALQLPPYLEFLNISTNLLTGDIVGEEMPMSLLTVDISHNELDGAMKKLMTLTALTTLIASHNKLTKVSWDELPEGITKVDVSHNMISNMFEWKTLQPGLQSLLVGHNMLSGTMSFEGMLRSLEELDISYNQFSGKVDLTKIPDTARFLYINNNRFTGVPDLTMLPVDLRRIIIMDNPWDKELPVEMLGGGDL